MKEKNKKLISEVIKDIEHDMTDEEILSLLASSKVSENTSKSAKDEYSFGQRMADKIAKFAGSWGFIFSFVAVLILCVAAIQAPLIMMSQNRQEEKDRRRAENDYKVNLKTEIMIEDMHNKLNRILSQQEKILAYIKAQEEKEESKNA